MLKLLSRTNKFVFIAALFVSCCATTGCDESSFELASESGLPKCVVIPPGLTRADDSVTLNLYAPLRGPDAKFVLTEGKGKKLAEVKGKMKELTPKTKGLTPSIYRI